jgi:hypothetical protein
MLTNVICHSDIAGQITYPVLTTVNLRRFKKVFKKTAVQNDSTVRYGYGMSIAA